MSPTIITVQIGPYDCPLTPPRTGRQRLRVLDVYLSAIDAAQVEGVGALERVQRVADVERAAAVAILRMLPSGHPLRADYDTGRLAAAEDAWRGYGEALLARLDDEGVDPADIERALVAATSGSRPPSQTEVDAAAGN